MSSSSVNVNVNERSSGQPGLGRNDTFQLINRITSNTYNITTNIPAQISTSSFRSSSPSRAHHSHLPTPSRPHHRRSLFRGINSLITDFNRSRGSYRRRRDQFYQRLLSPETDDFDQIPLLDLAPTLFTPEEEDPFLSEEETSVMPAPENQAMTEEENALISATENLSISAEENRVIAAEENADTSAQANPVISTDEETPTNAAADAPTIPEEGKKTSKARKFAHRIHLAFMTPRTPQSRTSPSRARTRVHAPLRADGSENLGGLRPGWPRFRARASGLATESIVGAEGRSSLPANRAVAPQPQRQPLPAVAEETPRPATP